MRDDYLPGMSLSTVPPPRQKMPVRPMEHIAMRGVDEPEMEDDTLEVAEGITPEFLKAQEDKYMGMMMRAMPGSEAQFAAQKKLQLVYQRYNELFGGIPK